MGEERKMGQGGAPGRIFHWKALIPQMWKLRLGEGKSKSPAQGHDARQRQGQGLNPGKLAFTRPRKRTKGGRGAPGSPGSCPAAPR